MSIENAPAALEGLEDLNVKTMGPVWHIKVLKDLESLAVPRAIDI